MIRARHLTALLIGLALTSPGGARADDAPAKDAPATTSRPDAGADWAADLIARTDDIAKEISALRGLKIKRAIKRDVMSVADLRARLVKAFDEDATPAELAEQQLALERWGLVPHGVAIHEVLLDVLTEQIAGFYDPEARTLYIPSREGGDDGFADLVMAHEIVHALQDQHFDLDKFTDLPDAEGDASLARQALVEGDGVVAMFELLLARQNTPPPWAHQEAVDMLTSSMLAGGGDGQLAKAPLVVRDLLMFPYARGMQFVAALRARSPWSRVDAAFKKPPQSTEQILHPERYLAGDDPPRVVTAGKLPSLAGWRGIQETVWGEAGWSVVLREHGVDAERAALAAGGWGGDRMRIYVKGDGPIADASPRGAVAVALTSWDADIDAMEFEEAAVLAVDHLVPGAIIENRLGRTVWLGVDARVSIVERKGDAVIVVIGAPLVAKDAIVDEVRKSWKVKTPKR